MHWLQRLRRTLYPVLLVGLVLATRIPFRSHYLYDIDSVNFALGMRRFNPTVHQPHPPGYFLYVCAGRVADILFPDPNAALVAISVLASCGTAVLLWFLARVWFGDRAAVYAGMLFVFSPLAWFHGTVALIYPVEAFFSALTGYLCWMAYSSNPALIVPTAAILGVATGFRPSSFVFLAPLLVFAVIANRRQLKGTLIMAAAAALIAGLTVWMVPMVEQSGGLAAWWSATRSLWITVPAKQTIFVSSPATSIARLISILGVLLLCFGSASFFVFRREPELTPRNRTFVLVWIAPALLFFTLVFFKFVNSGYLLVVSPPLFACLGAKTSEWYAGTALSRPSRQAVLLGMAAVNALIFLFAPVYCSYNSVRRFENELHGVLDALPKIASPADTMIVGFDSHFLGYRHAGYYLPEFFTIEYPEVRLGTATRIFAMQHGETRLNEVVAVGNFRNFMFFPLPQQGAEYRTYMTQVRARFPPGALRSVHVSGHEFLIGKASDLCFLFPEAR